MSSNSQIASHSSSASIKAAPSGARFDSPGRFSPGKRRQKKRKPQSGRDSQVCANRRMNPGISPPLGLSREFKNTILLNPKLRFEESGPERTYFRLVELGWNGRLAR